MGRLNIASERVRKGLTQAELADRLGVSVATVKSWEQSRSEPKGSSICEMADLFGCTSDYLLGRTDERMGDAA